MTAPNSEPHEAWELKNNTTRGYQARLTWSPGKDLWYPSCLFVLRQCIVNVIPQIDTPESTPEISHFRPNCIHDGVKTERNCGWFLFFIKLLSQFCIMCFWGCTVFFNLFCRLMKLLSSGCRLRLANVHMPESANLIMQCHMELGHYIPHRPRILVQ